MYRYAFRALKARAKRVFAYLVGKPQLTTVHGRPYVHYVTAIKPGLQNLEGVGSGETYLSSNRSKGFIFIRVNHTLWNFARLRKLRKSQLLLISQFRNFSQLSASFRNFPHLFATFPQLFPIWSIFFVIWLEFKVFSEFTVTKFAIWFRNNGDVWTVFVQFSDMPNSYDRFCPISWV